MAEVKDFNDFLMKIWIEGNIPQENRELARSLDELLYSSERKGFKRFSTWRSRLWMKFMETWDSRIRELEKRVKELGGEKDSLIKDR